MGFFVAVEPAPFVLPEGTVAEQAVYTGTACLAFMDAAVTGDVWEDLLFDGVVHDHGSGGLMLNSAAVGTHLEHDGDFPIQVVANPDGKVLGFRVNLDPYAEDLGDVRDADGHGGDHEHSHEHSHGGDVHTHHHTHDDHGHDHSHEGEFDDLDHGHSHGHGHADGWSDPERVVLVSDRAVFGDPAGLPEADDTGDLIDLVFPSAAGQLVVTVYTKHGLRRELRAVWEPAA